MTETILYAAGPIKRVVRSKRSFRGDLVGAIRDGGWLVMVRFDVACVAWKPFHVICKR